MTRTLVLLFLCAAAAAHGSSARTQSASAGGFVSTPIVPFGGGALPDRTPGPGPTTTKDRSQRHTWEVWWNYHREYYLAQRARGTPVTGLRALDDRQKRKELREGRLIDLLLEAIEDKDHGVRASAAVGLGKFGVARGVREALERHIHRPPEGWPDVREAATYGTGLLALAENRRFLATLAREGERDAKERSLALTGLMMDGTKESSDLLVPFAMDGQDRARFATHLLGFVETPGLDDFLWSMVGGGGGEGALAVTALGRRGARDYREALFRLLHARNRDGGVTRSVPIALGMMLKPDDEADLKRLARFIRDSRGDVVAQNFAVMALGQVGGEVAVELLRDLIRAFGDEEDRAFVYLALGLCGARSAMAREALLSEYERVGTDTAQSVLALACGIAKVPAAVEITIQAIEKPRSRDTSGLGSRGRFAGWAALALGFHGDARGLPAARRVLAERNDPFVQEQAAIAISLLQGSAAVPELMAILAEAGTMHAKAAVVTALAVLPEPSPEAVDALVRIYRDDSMPNTVRSMAIVALGALADPRPVPVSARLVRNYNYFIRCLALDEIASYL